MIKREKFYTNFGFKQIYIPQNDDVYSITGEKRIDNRNRDEKKLVKNYGNYFCLWKFNSQKTIITNPKENIYDGSGKIKGEKKWRSQVNVSAAR